MPWRKDGRCELWDPETSLVMEASEGEMGERRGRLRCQLLAAPLCRCWTLARVRRASSPEMSTRLSLQTACPPFFASSESESETLGEPWWLGATEAEDFCHLRLRVTPVSSICVLSCCYGKVIEEEERGAADSTDHHECDPTTGSRHPRHSFRVRP